MQKNFTTKLGLEGDRIRCADSAECSTLLFILIITVYSWARNILRRSIIATMDFITMHYGKLLHNS
jgi:hypothetical protein